MSLHSLDDECQPLEWLGTVKSNELGEFEFPAAAMADAEMFIVRVGGPNAEYFVPGYAAWEFGDDNAFELLVDREWLGAEPLAVNAWTTAAASLARAYCRNSEYLAADICIRMAHDRIAAHLWRPAAARLESTHPSWLTEAEFDSDSPEGALGLTLVGLAQLASDWTPEAADDSPVVRPDDVAVYLARDLSDEYFDGFGYQENSGTSVSLTIGNGQLDSETTRGRLVEAIYHYAAEQGPEFEYFQGGAPNALYYRLAQDVGPLYREEDVPPSTPKAQGPTLEFGDGTPAEGAYVAGDFDVTVVAKDNVGLVSVQLDIGLDSYELHSGKPYPPQIQQTISVDTTSYDGYGGDIGFSAVAQDVEGRITQVTRDVRVDKSPPQFGSLSSEAMTGTKDPSAYIKSWVEDAPYWDAPMLVEAGLDGDEDWPTAEIGNLFNHDSFTVAVALEGEGYMDIRMRVTDAAGNSSESLVSVYRDVTPPVLEVETPVGATLWTTADSVLLHGSAADDYPEGPFVYARRPGGNDVLASFSDAANWSIEIPTTNVAAEWQLYALDFAGHESPPVNFWVGRDQVAPTVMITSPQNAVSWTSSKSLVVEGWAMDSQSGVSGVSVLVNGVAYPAALQPANAFDQVMWSCQVLLGNKMSPDAVWSISAASVDALGNASAPIAPPLLVVQDRTGPVITLQPGVPYRPETDCSYNTALATVNCAGVPAVHVGPGCEGSTSCFKLRKLLNRLSLDVPISIASEVQLEQKNIPSIRTSAVDAAPIESLPAETPPPAPPTLSFRVKSASGFTAERPVPQSGHIPLAAQTFWESSTPPPNASDWPVGVEIIARDALGNQSTAYVPFTVLLATPPLHVANKAQQTARLATGAPWGFELVTLHAPFRFGGQGVEMMTASVSNPWPFPITFQLTEDSVSTGTLSGAVVITGEVAYLGAMHTLGAGELQVCGKHNCMNSLPSSAGLPFATCGTPPLAAVATCGIIDGSERTWCQSVPLPTTAISSVTTLYGPNNAPAGGAQLTLAPGESLEIRTFATWPTSCAVDLPHAWYKSNGGLLDMQYAPSSRNSCSLPAAEFPAMSQGFSGCLHTDPSDCFINSSGVKECLTVYSPVVSAAVATGMQIQPPPGAKTIVKLSQTLANWQGVPIASRSNSHKITWSSPAATRTAPGYPTPGVPGIGIPLSP